MSQKDWTVRGILGQPRKDIQDIKPESMKIGILRCKLFGHKFVYSDYGTPKRTDFCVRCGINREAIN